ncbi:hypothetical protein PR202_gb09029 [Eleusine coracana subsp. coracana]|uniref:Protein kinase domain-containing protein n=1 Tax=Eleusine coracana subsp. coracana TaxID=191504 RepID=A0AAV5EG73_ELECO|nr:hypothetical protein PR202_gb09029 [Eleusine coracana subsp. coracana]
MMIVSEYHQKGDLTSYMNEKGRLKPHKAIRFALDIAKVLVSILFIHLEILHSFSVYLTKWAGGLTYLHECKPDPIIHGNLSPNSSLSKSVSLLSLLFFGCVYIAPEMYRNEPFDRSVDVFAFGLILYEVCKFFQSTSVDTCEELTS